MGSKPVNEVPIQLMLSIDDVVAATGLGRTKVFELIASGELVSVRVARRRLVRMRDLEEFVNGLSGTESTSAR